MFSLLVKAVLWWVVVEIVYKNTPTFGWFLMVMFLVVLVACVWAWAGIFVAIFGTDKR